eukprot:jgi/Botrbrau1/10881/Bobra.0025s0058.1
MSYILETFFTPLLIIGWYAANIGVLLLNKYLLSYYGFKFPAFLTMCHMLSCSICTYACSRLKVVDTKRVTSRAQLVKIAVLASVFCISIVLGNISLRYIPVSFNQAIGATTPFFTAVLGFILVGERETFFVYASLIPVVGGIIMASGGEPLFNLFGFGAAMTATGARALKTVLQGILLSQVGDRLDSMSLLMYMSPIAATLLLPATLLMEGNVVQQVRDSAATYPWMLPMLAANSFMAFFCQPGKLPGDEAHQPPHSAGARQCQGRRGSLHFRPAVSQPHHSPGMCRLPHHSHWSHLLLTGEEGY